ncbi:MAG: hypothetical protein ABIC95_01970 [archaeon]
MNTNAIRLPALLILGLLAVSLMTITVVAQAENPCWTCVKNGAACTATCDYSRCTFYQCLDTPMCTCTGGSSTVDVEPPEVTIVSPLDTTHIDDNIFMRVELNEMASWIRYTTDGRRWITLCSNCHAGQKTLYRVGDGIFELDVEARDGAGNIGKKTGHFKVDTKPPVIDSILPPHGFYIAGAQNEEFSATYTENDVVEMTLHHKLASSLGDFSHVPVIGCPEGKDATCTATIDARGYPQGELVSFYFTLSDATTQVRSATHNVTVNATFLAQPIKMFSPLPGVHPTGRMDIDISGIMIFDKINSIDNDGRERTLCRNCDSYERGGSFAEGTHHYEVIGYIGAEEMSSTVDFEVETRVPRITSTEPRSGAFAHGVFSIKYNEDNLKEVMLEYGSLAGVKEVESRFDCPSGSRGECEIEVDLMPYDPSEIIYRFTVKDSLNEASTDWIPVVVDATKPGMIVNEPQDGDIKTSGRVLFDVTLFETVAELSYAKEGETRTTRLCSRCDGYSREQSLRDGRNALTIIAKDEAGNENRTNVTIFVDSRAPRISSTTPRRTGEAVGGDFTVGYMEDNPINVTLFLSLRDGTHDVSISRDDCPPGSRAECMLSYNLTDFDGEEGFFWFTVEDIASNLVGKSPMEFVVDAIPANMTVLDPDSGVIYGRVVPIEIALDKKVDALSYTDNGGREVTLCRSCAGYARTRSFYPGPHDLVFYATTFGGKVTTVERSITV